jgi:hypothetical protein
VNDWKLNRSKELKNSRQAEKENFGGVKIEGHGPAGF